MSAIIFQIQSTLILGLMIYGIRFAKSNNKKHVQLMSTTMIWDVLLILQIEINRHAVEKAITVSDNSLWLDIHVGLAICTVLLYGVMTYLGRALLKGQRHLAPLHKKLGLLTLVLRILTYGTSYTVV